MDFEIYLKERIKFLRQIRIDNKKKLEDQSDKMRDQWLEDKILIQAKLEECEITLHTLLFPDEPIDIDSLGK